MVLTVSKASWMWQKFKIFGNFEKGHRTFREAIFCVDRNLLLFFLLLWFFAFQWTLIEFWRKKVQRKWIGRNKILLWEHPWITKQSKSDQRLVGNKFWNNLLWFCWNMAWGDFWKSPIKNQQKAKDDLKLWLFLWQSAKSKTQKKNFIPVFLDFFFYPHPNRRQKFSFIFLTWDQQVFLSSDFNFDILFEHQFNNLIEFSEISFVKWIFFFGNLWKHENHCWNDVSRKKN
jgi:hypothetical protein